MRHACGNLPYAPTIGLNLVLELPQNPPKYRGWEMPLDQDVSLEKLKELLSGIDPEQLRQVMPLVGGVITMMFTDIVDSTRVKHEVGDEVYFEALKRHNSTVRECIARHGGHELK